MKTLKSILISVATFIIAQDVQAALTITFNTAAETLSFGGTETNGAGETHAWGAVGTDPNGVVSVGASLEGEGGTADLTVYSNNLTFFVTTIGALSGNATSVSYATLPAAAKNYILTINGNTYTGLDLGGGALGSISVTVVPEPSQYAALCGAALLGLGFLRRRSVGCSPIR
jgi:hypothetical protein